MGESILRRLVSAMGGKRTLAIRRQPGRGPRYKGKICPANSELHTLSFYEINIACSFDSKDGRIETGPVGATMDSDPRYYWRRACDEMAAASRAVTPAARVRHEVLVRSFIQRLIDLNAPCPFTEEELAKRLGSEGDICARSPAFSWQAEQKQTQFPRSAAGVKIQHPSECDTHSK